MQAGSATACCATRAGGTSPVSGLWVQTGEVVFEAETRYSSLRSARSSSPAMTPRPGHYRLPPFSALGLRPLACEAGVGVRGEVEEGVGLEREGNFCPLDLAKKLTRPVYVSCARRLSNWNFPSPLNRICFLSTQRSGLSHWCLFLGVSRLAHFSLSASASIVIRSPRHPLPSSALASALSQLQSLAASAKRKLLPTEAREQLNRLNEATNLLAEAVHKETRRLNQIRSEDKTALSHWTEVCASSKRALRLTTRVLNVLEKGLRRRSSGETPKEEEAVGGDDSLKGLCALLDACVSLLESWSLFRAQSESAGVSATESEFLHLAAILLWASSPVLAVDAALRSEDGGAVSAAVKSAVVRAAQRVVSVHPDGGTSLDLQCLSLSLYSLERLMRKLRACEEGSVLAEGSFEYNAFLSACAAALTQMTLLLGEADCAGLSGQTGQGREGFAFNAFKRTSRRKGWLRPCLVTLLGLTRLLEGQKLSLVEEFCLARRETPPECASQGGRFSARSKLADAARAFLAVLTGRLAEAKWKASVQNEESSQEGGGREDGGSSRSCFANASEGGSVLELSGRDLSLLFRCLAVLRFFDARLMRRLDEFLSLTPLRCGRPFSESQGEMQFSAQDGALLLWAIGVLNSPVSHCLYNQRTADVETCVSLDNLFVAPADEALPVAEGRSSGDAHLQVLFSQVLEAASKKRRSALVGEDEAKEEGVDSQALANAFWGAACRETLSRRRLRAFASSQTMKRFLAQANSTEKRQFLHAALSVLLLRRSPAYRGPVQNSTRRPRLSASRLKALVQEETAHPSVLQRRVFRALRVAQVEGVAAESFDLQGAVGCLRRCAVFHELRVRWGLSVDVALFRRRNKTRAFRSVDEEEPSLQRPPPAAGGRRPTWRRIAVEVQGPSHYTGEWLRADAAEDRGVCPAKRDNFRLREDGATWLKRRLLTLLGWKVVSLSFAEWQALEGRPQAQRRLLLEKLAPVFFRQPFDRARV